MSPTLAEIKITIVLCTYNGEKYLVEQLDSLINQTLPFCELIISDDASTDATKEIITTFEKKDNRIKVYQNKFNLGFNKNFETAIGFATGNWIAPADQDDIWELNKLELMQKDIKPGVTLVHCNSSKFYGDNFDEKKIYPHYRKFEGNDARQLFLYNTIEGHTMLFHQQVATIAFPIPDNLYFDWWLGFHAALLGSVVWNKSYLVHRRIHDQNSSDLQMAAVRKNKEQLKLALYYTQEFTRSASINKQVVLFGNNLSKKLQQAVSGKKSSLFFFLIKNRKKIFYYKPTRPIIGIISHLKAAIRFLKA